jgi:hypothetical protein
MSLSSDKLNGHPGAADPRPGIRSRRTLVGNGWPAARKAQQRKQHEAGTPADQRRRVDLAATNRERAIRVQRNEKLLEVYGIPAPVKVPGEKGLFSRWLKEKGDKKFKFDSLAKFCLHIIENHGDDEKDAAWRAYLAAAEPIEDAEEEQARLSAEAIGNVERQSTSVPVLGSHELIGEQFSHVEE